MAVWKDRCGLIRQVEEGVVLNESRRPHPAAWYVNGFVVRAIDRDGNGLDIRIDELAGTSPTLRTVVHVEAQAHDRESSARRVLNSVALGALHRVLPMQSGVLDQKRRHRRRNLDRCTL